jgi:tRNA(adenine34) deaminase
MREALKEARQAAKRGEVPIGAVVVKDGQIIARGHNQPISKADPTAHAEVVALRKAAAKLNSYRLSGCSLYVTLEPCLMCAGAMIHSRIQTLIYGTADPKGGAVASLYNILEDARLNHRVKVIAGILEEESRDILKAFFKARR